MATVSKTGRLVLPVELRKMLQIDGRRVNVKFEVKDGTVTIVTPRESIARVQAALAPYLDPKRRLSDELIAERRAEAAKEAKLS